MEAADVVEGSPSLSLFQSSKLPFPTCLHLHTLIIIIIIIITTTTIIIL